MLSGSSVVLNICCCSSCTAMSLFHNGPFINTHSPISAACFHFRRQLEVCLLRMPCLRIMGSLMLICSSKLQSKTTRRVLPLKFFWCCIAFTSYLFSGTPTNKNPHTVHFEQEEGKRGLCSAQTLHTAYVCCTVLLVSNMLHY